MDFFENRFNVRHFARLLDWWTNEALKLVAIDYRLYLRKLEVEFLDEVPSLYDEADIFIANYFLCG